MIWYFTCWAGFCGTDRATSPSPSSSRNCCRKTLIVTPGIDYRDRPAEYGLQKRADYIAHDYHQASDIPKPDWDLSGAVEDLQVLLEVGYRVAQSSDRPTWKPDAIWRPR